MVSHSGRKKKNRNDEEAMMMMMMMMIMMMMIITIIIIMLYVDLYDSIIQKTGIFHCCGPKNILL